MAQVKNDISKLVQFTSLKINPFTAENRMRSKIHFHDKFAQYIRRSDSASNSRTDFNREYAHRSFRRNIQLDYGVPK